MLLLCCVSCSSLKKDPSQEAKEIYKRGKENMKKMSYKATFYEPGGTSITYNKYNPDGTIYSRVEAKFDEFPPYLAIKNNDGEYIIYGNTALKANFQKTTEMSEEGEQAEYSLAEGHHSNIPCYIVTKKTKPDEGRYNSFIKSFSGVNYLIISGDSTEELRERFEKTFPATEICYIGKNDGFTYKQIRYNVHGKKQYSPSYDKVELNPFLDDNLFKISDNLTVIVANTPIEYDKIDNELFKKDLEPVLKKYRQRRIMQEKIEDAGNASLIDRIKRVNRIYDIDRMKKYSGSNTYLSDYLGL
jgi:hypothetical protein